MDALHMVCMQLSHGYLNGQIDNKLSDEALKVLNEAGRKAEVWAFFDGAERVVVHSCANADTSSPFEKFRFAGADIYFFGIAEPLRLTLNGGRTRWPQLPLQMFDEWSNYIDNPYCDSGAEQAIQMLMKFFIGLQRFVGITPPFDLIDGGYIETVEIDTSLQNVTVKCTDVLNEDIMQALRSEIDASFAANGDGHLDHLLKNFVPAMAKKVEHSPVKTVLNGKPAIRNAFIPVDWTEEELDRPVKKMIHELSLESTPNCPAYISHFERLKRYLWERTPEMVTTSPPFSKKSHGIDCADWGGFFLSRSGDSVIEYAQDLVLQLFEQRDLTLGKAIEAAPEDSKGAAFSTGH